MVRGAMKLLLPLIRLLIGVPRAASLVTVLSVVLGLGLIVSSPGNAVASTQASAQPSKVTDSQRSAQEHFAHCNSSQLCGCVAFGACFSAGGFIGAGPVTPVLGASVVLPINGRAAPKPLRTVAPQVAAVPAATFAPRGPPASS